MSLCAVLFVCLSPFLSLLLLLLRLLRLRLLFFCGSFFFFPNTRLLDRRKKERTKERKKERRKERKKEDAHYYFQTCVTKHSERDSLSLFHKQKSLKNFQKKRKKKTKDEREKGEEEEKKKHFSKTSSSFTSSSSQNLLSLSFLSLHNTTRTASFEEDEEREIERERDDERTKRRGFLNAFFLRKKKRGVCDWISACAKRRVSNRHRHHHDGRAGEEEAKDVRR